jgi:hypothetical protein
MQSGYNRYYKQMIPQGRNFIKNNKRSTGKSEIEAYLIDEKLIEK